MERRVMLVILHSPEATNFDGFNNLQAEIKFFEGQLEWEIPSRQVTGKCSGC